MSGKCTKTTFGVYVFYILDKRFKMFFQKSGWGPHTTNTDIYKTAE